MTMHGIAVIYIKKDVFDVLMWESFFEILSPQFLFYTRKNPWN